MKKTLLTLTLGAVAAGAMLGTGCKTKHNTSGVTLVGSWEERRSMFTVTETSTNPPSVLFTQDTAFGAGQGSLIEFRANSTYAVRENASATQVDDSGTYALVNGNKLVITDASGQSTPDTVNITLSASMFTLNIDQTFGTEREVGTVTYNRR